MTPKEELAYTAARWLLAKSFGDPEADAWHHRYMEALNKTRMEELRLEHQAMLDQREGA